MTTAVPVAVKATIETLAADPRTLDGGARVALLGDVEATRSWIAAREAELIGVIHRERDDVDAGAKDTIQLSQRQANVAFGEAKRRSLRAVWCAELPQLAAALETSRLGVALVDELCALADRIRPERRPTLRAAIAELVDQIQDLTPLKARGHLVAWEAALDERDGVDRSERQRRANAFRLSKNSDGTSRISGQIDPVGADELGRAIDQRVSQLWRAESLRRQNADVPPSVLTDDARRLQALLDLVRAGAASMPGVASSAQVIVLIDHETLVGRSASSQTCRLTDGTPVTPGEARRLACEAGIIPMVLGSGSLPLDVGREVRTATPAQRAALRVVHDSCGIHGCDVAFDHCQIHHIDWWRLGGRTDLANLIPLCSRHHHLVHDHRWDLVVDDQRVGRLVRRAAASPERSLAVEDDDRRPARPIRPRVCSAGMPVDVPLVGHGGDDAEGYVVPMRC